MIFHSYLSLPEGSGFRPWLPWPNRSTLSQSRVPSATMVMAVMESCVWRRAGTCLLWRYLCASNSAHSVYVSIYSMEYITYCHVEYMHSRELPIVTDTYIYIYVYIYIHRSLYLMCVCMHASIPHVHQICRSWFQEAQRFWPSPSCFNVFNIYVHVASLHPWSSHFACRLYPQLYAD